MTTVSPMNINIRKATRADVELILSLAREFAAFQGSLGKFTNTKERMRDEQDCFTCLLAEDEAAEAVGLVIYYPVYYTWVGKSLYVDILYVKDTHRGQTIGYRLLAAVLRVAQAENYQRVRWLVSNWNASAIAFYEKCGATVSQKEHVCNLDRQAILAFNQHAKPHR